MATRRRPSMRTRMKAEDVNCWVEHNKQPYSPHDEPRVRFEVPQSPPSVDDSDVESVESLTEKPVYHDGGYGWLIVLCSFLMHFVCDGASFSFGIVFVEIQNRFNVNRVTSMLTASLFLSLPLCLAPIAGITSDILGCRMSIIIGASVCALSSLISIYCSNIVIFTIFFGFGCGFGMSFIYNAAIVIVTYYFNSRRGIATSMAVAGTGAGTLSFGTYLSIVAYLFPTLTELESILIAYAAAYFLIAVLGLFVVRDISWESDSTDFKLRKFNKDVKHLLEDQENKTNTKKEGLLRHAISLPNLNIIRVEWGSIQSVCEVGKTEGKVEIPTRSKSVALFENRNQMPTIPEYSMVSNLANLEHLDLELANSPCTTVRAQRKRVISKVSMSVDQINELEDEDFKVNLFHSSTDSAEDDSESSSDDSEMSQDGDSSSSEISEKVIDEPTTKLISKNSITVAARVPSSAPTSARLNRNSLAPVSTNVSGGRILASNAIQSRETTNLLAMGKIPSAPMLVARKKRKSMFRAINIAILKRFTETEFPVYCEVLKSKSYIYLVLSVICLYAILDVPYVCFYEYMIEKFELSKDSASTIYMVIGFVNLCSTSVFGKLADNTRTRKYIHHIYTISMIGVAGTLLSAAFVTTTTQLFVTTGFFGFFVTSNYVLQSILITICFDDMNYFQGAYSMISMLEGIASLFGPPIFAHIREITGTYSTAFFIGAIVVLFATIFSDLFQRELSKEEDKEDEADTMENGKMYVEPFKEVGKQNGHGFGAETENLLDV